MDLTGQKFGRLRVMSLHHHTYGQYHWNLECDCGNKHIATTALLRRGMKSCGCIKKTNPPNLRHGHTRGRKETEEFINRGLG